MAIEELSAGGFVPGTIDFGVEYVGGILSTGNKDLVIGFMLMGLLFLCVLALMGLTWEEIIGTAILLVILGIAGVVITIVTKATITSISEAFDLFMRIERDLLIILIILIVILAFADE